MEAARELNSMGIGGGNGGVVNVVYDSWQRSIRDGVIVINVQFEQLSIELPIAIKEKVRLK